MYMEGSVVHYYLSRKFESISCDDAARRMLVDYPILYDVDGNMRGHSVLVPAHELPRSDLELEESICLCLSEPSATAARSAGFPVIRIDDDVSFPHLFNYLQAVFVRFERLDARLHAYVDTRAGIQALLDACAAAFGYPLMLVDDQYRTICKANLKDEHRMSKRDPDDTSLFEEETVDLFMASRNYQHMRSTRNVFTAPRSSDLLMKNLFVGGSLKGMLVSKHDGDSLSARYIRFILGFIASFAEEMHARMGSFGASPTESDRIRAALTRLLADPAANQAEIQSLLLANGHAPESSYVILHIERSFTYAGKEEFGYLARQFELAWPHAYCFSLDNTLFMLADISPSPATADRDFLSDILIVARDNLSKVGVSRPFTALERLDAARVQATAALSQGSSSDPTFWFYRFDDYALAWLIDHGRRNLPADYVSHPAVLALTKHDAEHGTELLRTLAVFMQCRYNATKAAEDLYVARSTLLNRLERIIELTGVDLDDANTRVYLGLSLRHVK